MGVSDEPMTLPEALVGLRAYREVDQRMALLWHGMDEAVIGPRTGLESSSLPGISISDVS
jgi:protein transport protein DSL1/ZW10